MKTKSIFLLFLLLFSLQTATNAQGWIIRRAINRKVEQKVDSAVDKSARDEAAKKQAEEQKQADQQNQGDNSEQKTGTTEKAGTKETGRGLFGGKIDIKYDDEYKFTGRIYMQMEMYDKKDVLKSDYMTYFNESTMNAGMDMIPVDAKDNEKRVPTTFLFDANNKSFMMLLNGDSKTGMISNIPSDSAMAAQSKNQKNTSKATVTKTGNSKMIAGYKCDEYKVVEPDKDGYSNIWMTKDLKIKADKKYWGKAGAPNYYGYPGLEGSVMLALESFDKNNKPAMKMETKEINEKFDHSISTKGYTFMKMNFGQSGKK